MHTKDQMYTCFYYLGVDPLAKHIKDVKLKHPHYRILRADKKDFTINLVGSEKAIQYIRIDIPDCKNKTLADTDLNIVQKIKEHTLAILRLSYEREISYLPFSFWTFRPSNDLSEFKIGLNIKSMANEHYVVDYDNLLGALIGTIQASHQVKVLSDSVNPNIPLRLQFLSAYSIIESRFQTPKGLNVDLLREFSQSNSSQLDTGKLIGMRDRCAHLKYKKHTGYIELNRADALIIEQNIDEIRRLACVVIQDMTQNKIKLWHG